MIFFKYKDCVVLFLFYLYFLLNVSVFTLQPSNLPFYQKIKVDKKTSI